MYFFERNKERLGKLSETNGRAMPLWKRVCFPDDPPPNEGGFALRRRRGYNFLSLRITKRKREKSKRRLSLSW